MEPVHIIGAGLAGSEAAWQIARAGVPVVLHEMRPAVETFAHKSGDCAEMVCSNSFRSDDDVMNAVGQLHWEMRAAGGLIMAMADKHKLPAGGALAVDREAFSASVTAALKAEPLITIQPGEITELPTTGNWIVATGPLTSDALAGAIRGITGSEALAFFDAIAPIVHADTIDMSIAWEQSRYDKGETLEEQRAYINCPMTKDEYEAFIDALLAADKTEFHEGETAGYFDGCLPIEVMAERGRETLRFGPMKPVGLTNVHKPDEKAYAVVQLRRDNALGTLYNIVGFQTKMKYGAQTQVFRMIPGPAGCQLCASGWHPPQQLLEFAHVAGRQDAHEIAAEPPLCRSGDGRRGLCRKRRDGSAGGPDGRRAGQGAGPCAARLYDLDGRAGQPHHRRGRGQDLPADEREFRPVPPGRGRPQRSPWPQGPLSRLYAARQG